MLTLRRLALLSVVLLLLALACKEDVAARGVVPKRRAEVRENFYERLVEDVMEGDGQFFTF